jgi:hypothetical protein
MPTPKQVPPFSVNPPTAALASLPEAVSSVVELCHLHTSVAKMEWARLYITAPLIDQFP